METKTASDTDATGKYNVSIASDDHSFEIRGPSAHFVGRHCHTE